MPLRDFLGIAQMIDRGVRNNDDIHFLQLVGLHWIAGAVVEKGIDEDPATGGVDQFVSGNAEETEFGGRPDGLGFLNEIVG